MLELLTGTGLATAAGLNAALPLLVLGALDRWTGVLSLPEGWQWLSHDWVLGILAVLFVLDAVADKIPGADHVNDVVQTAVRPTAGGLAFGAGSGTETAAVSDPEAFVASGDWLPVVIGVALALAVHLGKALARTVVNSMTLGFGAPVASVLEDVTSLGLSLAAVLLPVLVLVLLALLVWAGVRLLRRRGRRDRPPVEVRS